MVQREVLGAYATVREVGGVIWEQERWRAGGSDEGERGEEEEEG